ncbi:MAG: GNAT family N-acetyltransferase [Actinomycetales bacterium]
MESVLREPTLADVAVIGVVHHRCWVETYSALLPASAWDTITVESVTRRWRGDLSAGDPRHRRVVAYLEGELVGFAGSRPGADDDPVELWGLYVLAAHQGTGLGTRLMREVIGDGPATLWVARENHRAREFYRHHGFAEDGGTDVHDVAPEAAIPVVRMRR